MSLTIYIVPPIYDHTRYQVKPGVKEFVMKETEKMVQLMIRIAPAMIVSIDEWRRLQPDIPNRAETVRRLVEAGLEASAKRKVKAELKR
jgi:hypothetical protein